MRNTLTLAKKSKKVHSSTLHHYYCIHLSLFLTTFHLIFSGESSLVVSLRPVPNSQCQCGCRYPMVKINDSHHHVYYNIIKTGSILNCAQPCSGTFFTLGEQTSSSRLINIFAIGCLLCSLLVLFTFISDTDRFRYPERAIICLSACYIMVSLGFLAQIILSAEKVSCDGNLVRYSSSVPGSSTCIVVFFLIYYFSMAASLWWVILTLTWFLSTGLQWGTEPLSNYSLYFHLIAWIIPGIKSFIIVASGSVDGEPLAGICYVGNHNLDALMNFVIAPLCIYVGIGFTLLFAGFISIFQLRTVIRQQVRNKADKHGLEKLMVRILLFSVLYIIPTIIVICCNWYEYHNRSHWELNHNCPCLLRNDVPFVRVYLLKYCMTLGIGIVTFCWILSGKTFDSWNRCIEASCCCDKSRTISSHGYTHRHHHHHHTASLACSGNSSQRSYKQIR